MMRMSVHWNHYGLALDKAIDNSGFLSELHTEEPSELDRYCLRAAGFKAARLGKLNKGNNLKVSLTVFKFCMVSLNIICYVGLAKLDVPSVSLTLTASRNKLLHSQAPSLHDTKGLPKLYFN